MTFPVKERGMYPVGPWRAVPAFPVGLGAVPQGSFRSLCAAYLSFPDTLEGLRLRSLPLNSSPSLQVTAGSQKVGTAIEGSGYPAHSWLGKVRTPGRSRGL